MYLWAWWVHVCIYGPGGRHACMPMGPGGLCICIHRPEGPAGHTYQGKSRLHMLCDTFITIVTMLVRLNTTGIIVAIIH